MALSSPVELRFPEVEAHELTLDGPAQHLSVRADEEPGRVVLTLVGEVCAYTTPMLRGALDELSCGNLVVDLRRVDRMDATGLSFLVAATEARHGRGALTSLVVQGGLHQLVSYTRLVRLAAVCDSVDAALAA